MHKRNFVKFTDDDIGRIFGNDLSLKTRTIYLGNLNFSSEGDEIGIDAKLSSQLIESLHILNHSGNDPINLIMNTPGGGLFHGYAIYDAIANSSSPVDISVYGQAMSMGAIILQAGRVRRLFPNSVIMIHDGYNKDSERVTMRSTESWAEFSKWDRRRMYELFAQRSGRPVKYWEDKSAHDSIYTAEEAVRVGLADEVIPVADWRKRLDKPIR